MIVVNSYRFGGLDVATKALLDQAATDGYTAASGSVLTALDTYIKELKSAGIWSLIDVIYLPATNGDRDFAKYNIKDPTKFYALETGALTFTPLEGFTGAGGYLDTQFTPSAMGVNFTQDYGAISVYVRSFGAFISGYSIIGASLFSSTASLTNIQRLISGNINNRIMNGTPTNIFCSATASFMQHQKISNLISEVYQNGLISDSDSIGSSPISDQSLLIFTTKIISGGISSTRSSDQISNVSVSRALDSSQSLDNYNAIQNYMTALGTEV